MPNARQMGEDSTGAAIRTGAEEARLESQRRGSENWRLWGPYLAERAWGTVREDYSAHGEVWTDFPHEHARSRAYRWSEDGLRGSATINNSCASRWLCGTAGTRC
ncbi:MAG: hypothetical protein JO288_02445 [Hyphomicrobiales bacterium]|nr:hypothetical protein [Hyphomicrobiales bacterium]